MSNSVLPLTPGGYTQEVVEQIKRDASQETFSPGGTISRSTIFRSKAVNGKRKFDSSKAGNK